MRDETHPSKLGKSRAEKSNKQSNAAERSGHSTGVAPRSMGRFPMVEVLEDGSIGLNCEPILKKALGTTDDYFVQGIIRQLIRLTPDSRIVEDQLNFMLSFIKDINPRNQLEAMLGTQMATVHVATMTLGQRLAHAKSLPEQDSAERALNKLARTFTLQMEALQRYRSGGEQTVTVQHVSVNEGGQAIVGNVTQAPPGNASAQAAEARSALTDAKPAPMTILGERVREPAPIQRREKDDTPA
jgi:hypothetical protein